MNFSLPFGGQPGKWQCLSIDQGSIVEDRTGIILFIFNQPGLPVTPKGENCPLKPYGIVEVWREASGAKSIIIHGIIHAFDDGMRQ
jgi:hypothetical protein